MFIYPDYLDVQVLEELWNSILISFPGDRGFPIHLLCCCLFLSFIRTCCRTRLALCTWNPSSWKEKVLPPPFETNQKLVFQWGWLLNTAISIFPTCGYQKYAEVQVWFDWNIEYTNKCRESLNITKKIKRISLKATSDNFPVISLCVILEKASVTGDSAL